MATVTFNKEATTRRLQKAVKSALYVSARQIQKETRNLLSQHDSSGGIASEPGTPPGHDSGSLMASIKVKDVTENLTVPTYRIGSNSPYAAIQEHGGIIRAKKGKFLAVPVNAEGKAASKRAKGNLRNLNLRVVRTGDGKLFLVRDAIGNEASTFKILFILVKEVKLPARPYMYPAYENTKLDVIENVRVAIASVIDISSGRVSFPIRSRWNVNTPFETASEVLEEV